VAQLHPLGGADEGEVVDRPALRVKPVDPALKPAQQMLLVALACADRVLGGLEFGDVVAKGKRLGGDRLDLEPVGPEQRPCDGELVVDLVGGVGVDQQADRAGGRGEAVLLVCHLWSSIPLAVRAWRVRVKLTAPVR
jgi:hypothetical protein